VNSQIVVGGVELGLYRHLYGFDQLYIIDYADYITLLRAVFVKYHYLHSIAPSGFSPRTTPFGEKWKLKSLGHVSH
jgi:hypothetical protein